jgi:hypothetical protein
MLCYDSSVLELEVKPELHFSYSLQCCGDPCTVFWMRCQLEFKRPDVLNWVQQCVNKHLLLTERYIPQNPLIESTKCSSSVFSYS